jgi:hypothetical protein
MDPIWLQGFEGYVLFYGSMLLVVGMILYALAEECHFCKWTKYLYEKIFKKE